MRAPAWPRFCFAPSRGAPLTLATVAVLVVSCVSGSAGTAPPTRTPPPARRATLAPPAAPASATATATPSPAVATSTPTVAPTAVASAVPTVVPTAAPTATPAAAATAAPGTFSSTDNTWTDSTAPTAIPIGDGRVSTTARAGYVDSCTSSFRGGGAMHDEPWLNSAAGTWNETTKIAVTGERTWPGAVFQSSVQGHTRVITIAAVPVGLPTGTFPIAPTDPAYQYDRNPNAIASRTMTLHIPANPTAAATPSCATLGIIGVTRVGVVLFNALDDAGRDAGAHKVQDACHGHPNGGDLYHYHSISQCLEHGAPNTSTLVGYAIDGYGIYAEWNAAGHLPTNADLDACHGRTSSVMWDGQRTTMYHYDVTLEYPYTVGCFHGTPVPMPPGGP